MMMNSLFSSFDPMSSTMSTNYIIMMVPLMVPMSLKLNLINNRTMSSLYNMFLSMEKEMKTSIMNSNNLGKTKMLMTVLAMLLLFNLMGMVPYLFTITAQLMFTLSLSIPFWMSFILFSSIKNSQSFMAHLVPSGTPMALSQFMVLIESVSQLIRPITLSVRLAANMTAGHILMALASSPILMMNHMTLALSMLFLLELAVAFIQSYVFVTLLSMYLSETK